MLLLLAVFTILLLAAVTGQAASGPGDAQPGCWPAKTHAPGSTQESIETGEGTRHYRLHVPSSYSGVDRVPLVVALHALGGSPSLMEGYSGLSTRADEPDAGFIVVYPEAVPDESLSDMPHWNNTQLPAPRRDDVAFISELLDTVPQQLCIDSDRVFATGFSNGGMMSVRLACSLSSRIAAVAPVGGVYYPAMLEEQPDEACQDTRPVPVIAFHGTDDIPVPFGGGPGYLGTHRLPIDTEGPGESVMGAWAAHNGCASGRQETQWTAGVRLVHYDDCAGGATLQLYAIDGGGHEWPGSSSTDAIDANEPLWAFFQAHPMPGSAIQPDFDGDGVADAIDADNDNDGCPDTAETGSDPLLGGRRNPNNFWDYFDTPDVDGVRDQRIRLADVIRVASRYRADDDNGSAAINRKTDPLSVPPATGYHPAFDRGGQIGSSPWSSTPPDGQILAADILSVVYQYYHDCA